MKKVYCVIFDYQGDGERLQAIYETEKDAIERLVAESRKYGYDDDDIADFMCTDELSLVEWECGLNNHRVIL